MAEYLNSAITGSFTLPLVMSESIANTGSAGGLYYNLSKNRVYYTYYQEGGSGVGSWSAGPNINTARSYTFGNAGSRNAGLLVAGATPTYINCTEEYNGTSWATGPGQPSTQGYGDGAGTQNDFATHGGYYAPTRKNYHQYYNGSSWSNCTALPSANRHHVSVGDSGNNAGLTGGYPGSSWSPGRCDYQLWNGSSWSSGPNSPQGAGYMVGAGVVDDAMVGFSAVPSGWPSFTPRFTNLYNGSTWSSGPDPGCSRYGSLGGGVNASSTIGTGGYPGSYPSTNYTQEWCFATETPQQGGSGLSTCAYTNESNLIQGRYDGGGAGESKNSAVVFGGYVTPGTNTVTCTEEWDGSAWNSSAAIPISSYTHRGVGTQNAANSVGAYIGGYAACHFEYNGSTWASSTATPQTIGYTGVNGTQNDVLINGGYNQPTGRLSSVAQYNGSTWNTETSLPVANHVHHTAGASSNSAISVGGNQNTYGNCAHYDYDGSTWSSGPNMSVGVGYGVSGGTADCMMAGHSNLSSAWPSFTRCTQLWDGTTWSAGPSYDTNKYGAMGNSRSGTSTIGAGGYPGSYPSTAVAQSFEVVTDEPVYICQWMNSRFTGSAATGSLNCIKLAYISGSGA